MAHHSPTRASDWVLRILGLLPLGLLYLLLPARNHTEAEDSVPYIMRVTDGAPTFHPNHLLFEPAGSLVLRIARLFGHAGSAEMPMQVLNSLGAFAALLVAVHLVATRAQETGSSARQALMAGLLIAYGIGTCFGFWHYATEAETYLLPFAFTSIALALLAGAPIGPARAVCLGLAVAAAILLHQKFVFFGAMAGLWLLVLLVRNRDAQKFGPVALYALLSAGPVIGMYLYAYSTVTDPAVQDFLSWARGYASDGLWDPPGAATPVKAVVGLGSSIVTLNAFFSLPGFSDAISSLFAGKSLLEERYLAETSIPLAIGLMILTSFVLAACLAVLAILRAWRMGFHPRVGFDRFLVVYIIAYAGLVSIWEPLNREFWIHVVAVALILFGRSVRWQLPGVASLWGAAVGLVFVGNLLGAILPMSSRSTDFWYASNADLIATLQPGDVVVSDCGWICGNYLTFYAGATVLAPSFNTPEHLDQVLGAREETASLYLSSWAFSSPEGLFIATTPGTRETFLEALDARLSPLPSGTDQDSGALVQKVWKRTDGQWETVISPD